MKFMPFTVLILVFNLLSLYPDHNYYQTVYSYSRDTIVQNDPLFKVKESHLRSSQFGGQLKNGTTLSINRNKLEELRTAKNLHLDLSIPFNNTIIEVDLHQVNILADDFKVRTSDSQVPYPYTPGLFYSGHVKGDPKSLVSFSIYDTEVNGIFSIAQLGDLALVKTNNPDDEYLIFNKSDLSQDHPMFQCMTGDDDLKFNKIKPQIEDHLEGRAAGCVTIDFEFDDEIYKDFGKDVNTVTNWFTSLFNHIKTIYTNEQIDINVKSLYIWTTTDPYSSDVGTALDDVMAARQNDASFTGNLHHLVMGNNGSSISGVAYLGVICSRNFRFGATRLYQYTTWSSFPSTYQWDIGSIAHELGHNFGSHHTQWCGWAGGAIDNCASVEGSCTGPSSFIPTIMSYCHNVPAYRNYPMTNGFGPLPHAVIYSNFVAATCKSSSCGGTTPTPTCNDGIQNGNETGVDCGGSCTPCGGGGTPACPSPTLISQGKTATQSSNYDAANSYPASRAVDGSTAGTSFNHTGMELQPWLQIDLGASSAVTNIEITHRTGCPSCAGRTKKFRVFITSSPVSSYNTSGYVYEYNTTNGLGDGQVLNISGLNATGRYVRIWADNSTANPLHLAEVKVMGCAGAGCTSNQNPTVSASSSASSYIQGSSFVINASANDPDGSISSVEFYNGSTLLGTDSNSPFSFTVNPATATSYSIKAKAFDNCNGSTTSNTLTIQTTASCSDGFQNGTETGVDCGGSCTACQGCSSPTLLSQGKTATQSSNYDAANSYPASKAVDGSTAGTSFNHTGMELQPWLQIDLGASSTVKSIEITHRTGCPSCAGRTKKFRVFITSSPVNSYNTSGNVYEYNTTNGLGDGQVLNISGLNATGRYVRIWADNSTPNPLHLAEVKVMGCAGAGCTSNQNPTVSASSSASSYIQGSSFVINASANDPDGSISSVEFYNGSTLLGTDSNSPFSFTVNPATATSYSIKAKAIDDCNGSTTSNTLTIQTTASCSDGFQNGTETGVDCGGSCTACQGCSSPTVLSQGKTATQSSNYDAANSYPASKVVDGSIAGTSFNHTGPESQPWLQIDLGASKDVTSIEITHRTGCPSCAGRTKKFRVFVTAAPVNSYNTSGNVYEYNTTNGLGDGQVLNISSLNATGRYVRIWADNSSPNYLHFAEIKIKGCNTGAITSNNNKDSTLYLDDEVVELTVFPVPARNTLNLMFSKELGLKFTSQIFDLSGRLLFTSESENHQIDVSRLQNGSYILQVQLENGVQFRKKVIKME